MSDFDVCPINSNLAKAHGAWTRSDNKPIDILSVGEEGRCQCEDCLEFRDCIDAGIVRFINEQ